MWAEFELKNAQEKPSVKFDPAPEQKKNILTKFLTASEEEDVTHIAFINKKTPETSSWTYAMAVYARKPTTIFLIPKMLWQLSNRPLQTEMK